MHIESREHVTNLISDAQQFTRLYETHYQRVLTYMAYRCDNEDTAEELTAQVFERVLNHLSTYKAGEFPFEAWLFAIARNIVADFYRKRLLFGWLSWERMQRRPAPTPSAESQIEQKNNRQVLMNALTSLKPRERDLLALRFGAEYTNRKIAAQTGLSEQNVAVIIYRALKKLKIILEEEHQFVNTEVSHE